MSAVVATNTGLPDISFRTSKQDEFNKSNTIKVTCFFFFVIISFIVMARVFESVFTIGFATELLNTFRGTQRNISLKYLFGRRFEI